MDKKFLKTTNNSEIKKGACFTPLKGKKNHVAVLVQSMLPNGYTASDREKLKEFEKRIMSR